MACCSPTSQLQMTLAAWPRLSSTAPELTFISWTGMDLCNPAFISELPDAGAQATRRKSAARDDHHPAVGAPALKDQPGSPAASPVQRPVGARGNASLQQGEPLRDANAETAARYASLMPSVKLMRGVRLIACYPVIACNPVMT